MARVFYDLSAQAGEYEDREGKKKHRYQRMGKLIAEDDGRMWGVLEVLGLEVRFNVFPQQDRDSGGNGGGRSQGGGGNSGGGNRSQSGGGSKQSGGRPDIDDDIPF
jgi:single-stranded DNA-binding protein